MADIFSEEKRSDIMSRIKASGTEPEERLYSAVRGILGHRWRIDRNRTDLPGRPDIVVPTLELVVQVYGCFWHMCPEHGHIPNSNRDYWEPKLRGNVERDEENEDKLRNQGYSVWSYWGHDFKNQHLEETEADLERRLTAQVDAWRESG